MKSLRTRMTIMIVLLVLGSSVFLSFISYQRAKTSLINQLEDNYNVAAQKYALELTSWVNTNATIIDTMAAEIAVNDITNKDYETFHKYLKDSNDLLNKNGYVYDVYFTYPDNTMVCASDFIADGTVDFVHEREWYTTSALTGELFYSAPYLDSDTMKPVITISKAVYEDGDLLGVLAADIFVDVLVDMINDADVGRDCYAFLIDQHNRMIVHPYDEYDYVDYPKEVMAVSDAPYESLMEHIATDSDEMIFIKDYDGTRRGISFARMTNTGWCVCIATSEKIIENEVRKLVVGFVIATLVSVVIGVVVAIFLARVLDRLNKQEQEYRQQVLKLEKQAADKANEAKSRFLADMSHEIRTPINAIIGMNEMILRESEDEEILGYAQNIRQSGHNLLQLINGILDFSKIEDGKMEIVCVRYAVRSQITYIINSIAERAASKNLELNINIDPSTPSELNGDDTRINQVLINLLTNAVKYTEKGSVTITSKVLKKDEDEGRVLLYYEVKDTGIGIKESDMNKLFESFERLDVVKNRNIEGTGLGMTITRRLLELMGSELKVESEYGVGSTFSFELWQKIEDETPLGDYREAFEKTAKNTYRESFYAPDAHILVVDDTRMNLIVIENLLKKTGIVIDTAISGEESIELAKKNSYDVILMDQRMPGMDGTEAMGQIREIENRKYEKVPVICLTADVVRGARDKYLKMGFDNYLTKPVDSAELEKMLLAYIPKDKIREKQKSDKDARDDKEPSLKELGKILGKDGIDVKTGLSYCGSDEELYRSFLYAYVKEEKDKEACLNKAFAEKDWKNYGVYVHSLKSTSRMIGAVDLSEKAADLERAANDYNAEVITARHDSLMAEYASLVKAIKDNTDIPRGVSDESLNNDATEDDGIMEFLPEEN